MTDSLRPCQADFELAASSPPDVSDSCHPLEPIYYILDQQRERESESRRAREKTMNARPQARLVCTTTLGAVDRIWCRARRNWQALGNQRAQMIDHAHATDPQEVPSRPSKATVPNAAAPPSACTAAKEASARAAVALPSVSTAEASARAAAVPPSASTAGEEASARAAAALPSESTAAKEASARSAAAPPSAVICASRIVARTVLLSPTAHNDGKSGWQARGLKVELRGAALA
jgi:hypothetical protein